MADVSFNKVFLYDHVYELLAVGDNPCFISGDNGPMSNLTPLKCHRGIDNKLIFRVLSPDRTPVDVSCHQQVYARIIDPENRMIVLEKLCNLGPATGLVTLYLDAGDLSDIHAGRFEIVLIRTQEFVDNIPGYYIEKPLFSDLNDNVAMQLEITDQALKSPAEAITLYPKDWTKDILAGDFGQPRPCFYSGRLNGARILNHKDSVHSFSTYTKNATGILELWGTLDETPDPYLNHNRYFPIYPSSMSKNIEFIGYTGTQAWSFSANFMWVRFRYFPSMQVLDPGVLEKLIWRP